MTLRGWLFFNPHQAATVEAIAARLFPTDSLGPGATEAGVVNYIDRALAGPYADLQETYRLGLAALEGAARAGHARPFATCDTAAQDHLLAAMERGDLSFQAPDPIAFFDLLLAHTQEGLFSDPTHGGNLGAVIWKLLGFPGVQAAYAPEDHISPLPVRKERLGTTADVGRGRREPGTSEEE